MQQNEVEGSRRLSMVEVKIRRIDEDISVWEETFSPLQPDGYASHILHQLAAQQEKRQNTDFVLSCQGSQLACHRGVLAAASLYFDSLFRSGLKEEEKGVLDLSHINSEVLQWMVDFIYARRINVPIGKVSELYEACDLFQIGALMKQINVYIVDHITAKNCLYWWKMARRFNLRAVDGKAKHIMISDFENVSQSDDFLQLSKVEFEEYLGHPELKISHQDKLLHACISWVLADVESRKPNMLEILKFVELDKCLPSTLNEIAKTHNKLFTELRDKDDLINIRNCAYWWKMATKFNMGTVGEKAMHIMISDFGIVSQSDDFLQLSKAELEEYIRHPELKIPHQDMLLHVCISWVLAKKEARKPYMLDMLKLIKLDECTPSTVIEVATTYSELFSDPTVKEFMFDKFMAMPNLRNWKSKKEAKVLKQKVIIMGGVPDMIGNCAVLKDCWGMECQSLNHYMAWDKVVTIPEMVQGKQTAFVRIPEGFAVLCGGQTNTCNMKYDMSRKAWLDLPSMPCKMTAVVPLYTDGKIHVLDGGLFSGIKTSKMVTLDLFFLRWDVGPSLLVKQFRPIAVAHEQSLYVVQNDDYDENIECSMQVLSPGATKWVFKSSVPEQVHPCGANMVGLGNSLFLVGGFNKTCARYDILTDAWTDLKAKPSLDHWCGSAFVLGRKIYVCGGGWAQAQFANDKIEEYDPESGLWSLCSMRLPGPMLLFTVGLWNVLPGSNMSNL